jgi:hypothetical protein
MKLSILLVFVITALTVNAQKPNYPVFSAEQLQKDADSLYLQMQWNHPDLYAHFSKGKADSAFAALKHRITRPLNRLEFTTLLSPFVASFMDGHTFVDVDFDSEDFKLYTGNGGLFFPFKVRIIDGRLYVGAISNSVQLKKGDEIITINNIPSGQVVDQLVSLWSADGKANAISTAQRLFAYSVWVAFQWGNKVSIVADRAGKTIHEEMLGVSKEEFLKMTFNMGGTVRQLHLFPGENMAVVEINSYGNVEKSNKFIDSCFTVIRDLGIKNVALDLRKNGGGNSYIGDYFLAHVNRKPYNTVTSKRWRLGPLVNSLPENHYLYAAVQRDRKTYKNEGGYLQSVNFEPMTPPSLKDSTLFVDVNFFLLTSARTYSSAHMTAMAVKCGDMGMIIGQATGERLDPDR